MCKVGGPRCKGSHTPSARQRARRKANNAYRKAVAEKVGEITGDRELTRRVKKASMTDMYEITKMAGIDGEKLAAEIGTVTYTSPMGIDTTVDVEPSGKTRRTPVSDDTKQLLENLGYALPKYKVDNPDGERALSLFEEGNREGLEVLESKYLSEIEEKAGELDENKLLTVNSDTIRKLHQDYWNSVEQARLALPYKTDIKGDPRFILSSRGVVGTNDGVFDANGGLNAEVYRNNLERLATLTDFSGDENIPAVAKKLVDGMTATGDVDTSPESQKMAHWAYRAKNDPMLSATVRRMADEFDAACEVRRVTSTTPCNSLMARVSMYRAEEVAERLKSNTYTQLVDGDEARVELNSALKSSRKVLDERSTARNVEMMEVPPSEGSSEPWLASLSDNADAEVAYIDHVKTLTTLDGDIEWSGKHIMRKVQHRENRDEYTELDVAVSRYTDFYSLITDRYVETDNEDTHAELARRLVDAAREVETLVSSDTDLRYIPKAVRPDSLRDDDYSLEDVMAFVELKELPHEQTTCDRINLQCYLGLARNVPLDMGDTSFEVVGRTVRYPSRIGTVGRVCHLFSDIEKEKLPYAQYVGSDVDTSNPVFVVREQGKDRKLMSFDTADIARHGAYPPSWIHTCLTREAYPSHKSVPFSFEDAAAAETYATRNRDNPIFTYYHDTDALNNRSGADTWKTAFSNIMAMREQMERDGINTEILRSEAVTLYNKWVDVLPWNMRNNLENSRPDEMKQVSEWAM